MATYICHCLLVFFLVSFILSVAGCKTTIDAPIVEANAKTPSDQICPNVSGTYSLFGEPLPGLPDYFRVRAIKLSLDVLLGLDLSDRVRDNTKDVRVSQDETIKIIADRSIDASANQTVRELRLVAKDKVNCQGKTITIQLTRNVSGEAVHGTSIITHKLSLENDGSLNIETTIDTLSTSLFITYSEPREEYGARFKRSSPN